MKFLSWITRGTTSMLSGKGRISAKRVCGVWLIALVSFCILWLMIHEGGTGVVESLLETSLIIAASLLGLSSVTGIFKENKVEAKVNKLKGDQEESSEEANE